MKSYSNSKLFFRNIDNHLSMSAIEFLRTADDVFKFIDLSILKDLVNC